MKSEMYGKSPIDSDEGSGFAFEVVNKYDNYSDMENTTETIEYLDEEHVLEEFEDHCSEQMDDERDPGPIVPTSINKVNPTNSTQKRSLFTEGECEIFGVFVANEMKTFDIKNRKVFKRKVLQLLLDMEEDD